jgi:hypothetical protein
VIAGFASGRHYGNSSGVAVDHNIHKNIKTYGNTIRRNAIGRKGVAKVFVAATAGAVVAIHDSKHFGTAGCEQKIMSPYRVFDHREHYIAAIAIKRMSFGKINGLGIVNSSARRQVLFCIMLIETNEVGNLLALQIYDFKPITFF